MLPKQDNKIDADGYITLFLSMTLIIATAGLSYFYLLRKTFQTANSATLDSDKDAVVFVLGKKLVNNKPDLEYVQRLKRAHNILTNNKYSQVIILGGRTGQATISEAHAGKLLLEEFKADPLRINLEETSRNTLENIKNAINVFSLKNKKIVIVSNRYHLARAKKIANGFGLNVELCAAEEKLNLNLLSALKIITETFHIHWYSSGKAYARLTNNTRIMSRIENF